MMSRLVLGSMRSVLWLSLGVVSTILPGPLLASEPDAANVSSGAEVDGSPATPVPAEARSAIDRALAAYDRISTRLAADDPQVADDSGILRSAVLEAGTATAGPIKESLAALGQAVEALIEDSKKDLQAARNAFAVVSRHLMALLVLDPSLQKSLHVFECPMVEGYRKWVQTSAEISNPYMGSKMLRCGFASSWEDHE